MSSSWPTLASSLHRSTLCHSTLTPRYPNIFQWDYICCGKEGNTVTESAGGCSQTAPPYETKIASVCHCSPDHYRNHRKTPSFSYGDIRWCLRSRQSISSEVRGVTMKPLALAMGRSHHVAQSRSNVWR